MRKNGSRLLTVNQYRAADLTLFGMILLLSELLIHLAIVRFPTQAIFTLSFMLPICFLVMVRWGWPSILYAVASGVIYCALNKGNLSAYLIYGLGNAFIGLALIAVKYIGGERILKKWGWGFLAILCAGLAVYLGRSLITLILVVSGGFKEFAGVSPAAGFTSFMNSVELLSLVMAFVIVLPLRKFDGMVEDQKSFLRRLDKERRDAMTPDQFGGDGEIDEALMSIIKKDGNKPL